MNLFSFHAFSLNMSISEVLVWRANIKVHIIKGSIYLFRSRLISLTNPFPLTSLQPQFLPVCNVITYSLIFCITMSLGLVFLNINENKIRELLTWFNDESGSWTFWMHYQRWMHNFKTILRKKAKKNNKLVLNAYSKIQTRNLMTFFPLKCYKLHLSMVIFCCQLIFDGKLWCYNILTYRLSTA